MIWALKAEKALNCGASRGWVLSRLSDISYLYTLHNEPPNDGTLLLGRDMQPVAEVQKRFVR